MKPQTFQWAALTMGEHREDMELIREIGANTVRLAHYQHAQEFYDLCDEYGMIAWAEILYITQHMPEGQENTLSQMRELVTQCYTPLCCLLGTQQRDYRQRSSNG